MHANIQKRKSVQLIHLKKVVDRNFLSELIQSNSVMVSASERSTLVSFLKFDLTACVPSADVAVHGCG